MTPSPSVPPEPPDVPREPSPEISRTADPPRKIFDDGNRELSLIADAGQLDAVLAEPEKHRMIWVKLAKDAVNAEQKRQLAASVDGGGVLWLSTDLAGEFGFPVVAAPEKRTTMFTNPSVHHEILKGIKGGTSVSIGYAPGDVLIVGELSELATQMTPLLAWSASASSVRALVACAERKQGQGVLVFRPREIDTASDAGRTFEENLRAWSFAFARAPAANDKQPMSSDAIPPDPMAQAPGSARLWKDRTGNFSVEAQYLGFADNQVRLRRTGGLEIGVALERLSEADQQYVSQIRQTGRAHDASSH